MGVKESTEEPGGLSSSGHSLLGLSLDGLVSQLKLGSVGEIDFKLDFLLLVLFVSKIAMIDDEVMATHLADADFVLLFLADEDEKAR
jgi:hypothetical protein